jgi:hypothetical protein
LTARTAQKFSLVIALVVVLALAPIAFAAKGGGGGGGKPSGGGGSGGGGGGGTISLATPLYKDVNGDGLPNFGDYVEFNVSTTATTQPYVNLQCFQNGVLVASGWRGYFSGSLDYPYFGLYGGSWASGGADCTAYLDKGSTASGWTQLASTSFHVYG